MRGWTTFALFMLCAALAVPGAAQPIASAPSGDRAYWLTGAWICRSALGSRATQTYAQNTDGSLSLTTRLTAEGGRTGEYDDAFHFDPATNRWSWRSTAPGPAGLVEQGTAGPWTADAWTFDGTESILTIEPNRVQAAMRMQRAVRVTFTMMSESAYQREFDVHPVVVNGHRRLAGQDAWVAQSVSVCVRPGSPAPSAASP